MPRRLIVDLFAGAGGWDEGLRALGRSALGIDADPIACASAEAAGHERLLADLAALDPADFAPVWGLIASPPCQAYSSAGKRLGKLDKSQVIACARELASGRDTRARRRRACADAGSLLTVEPLRWALALRPRWLGFEQVPAVAELWSLFAELLEAHGYRSATGLLSAERYGVPQVRRRAFLIASLDGEVSLPEPTHRSYSPRCHEVPEDERELPSWISMAKALGWAEPAAMLTNRHGYGARPEQGRRPLDRPSYTIVSSSYEWRIEPSVTARSASSSKRARAERLPADCARHEARRQSSEAEGSPWPHRRPATTLLGDARVTAPGSWPRAGRRAELVRSRPVRVTPEQAAVLQGFRHDYPFQGSRTARFLQIGNAVCPPLAEKVLGEAMRPSMSRRRRGRGGSR